MSTYLVLAHQTARSPELLHALKEKAQSDPEAEFVLLVPETPAELLLSPQSGAPRDVARRTAKEASESLSAENIRVRWTIISDQAPVVALQTEVADHQDEYAGIIVSTFPEGISRWLESYVLGVAEQLSLPLTHVVTAPPPGVR